MTETLSLSRASLGQAVAPALESLLDGEPVEVRPEPQEFVLAATVGIIGTHNATVVVRTNEAAARRFAAEMFGVPDDEASDADMSDALLELTNVLGGAAKTAIIGENTLTIPALIPVDLTEIDVRTAENVISFAVHSCLVSIHVVNGAFVTAPGGSQT